MSKIKGKHIEFNDLGTGINDVWSADKIISYVGSYNPFDQDLNITDDVIFNDLEVTGNIELPATTSTVGQIKQNGETIFQTFGTNNLFLGPNAGNYTTTGNGNSALGTSALNNNTTGSYNSALGYRALNNNTTGSYNSAFGNVALNNNTTGSGNSAVGTSALNNNTTGSGNSAVGYAALEDTTTGNGNSAVGSWALLRNTTGSGNSAFGNVALLRNTTGSYNVAIGQNAGYSATGSGNIFLGYKAGYYETGSNKLYISNSNTANPLIYGEFDNNFITINGDLNITGKMNIPLRTITNSTDAGTAGEICYDANFIYICVATNTWKRVAIGTW